MADNKAREQASHNPITAVLVACRGAFIGIGLVSGIINLLTLTGSIFMMQVYDRVLASQSVPTLIALSVMAVAAYAFQGWLDILRGRVLMLIGERVDAEIGPKVHTAVIDLPLRGHDSGRDALQPFRQLEAVRSFLTGAGPVALFDMPWMPIYLVICFALHPLIGVVTLSGALALVVLTLLTEIKSKAPGKAALEAQSERNAAAEAAQRGAEVVRAMGMLPALAARWEKAHKAYLLAQRRANHVVGGLSATAKMSRLILQSTLLGLGGYLAVRGEISPGTIIAGSIIGSRALAPVDQAIASWKSFVGARQGYQRLKALLTLFSGEEKPFALPPPRRSLVIENLTVAAPGTSKPIVRRLSFKLEAGQALGIIGPSASGKTTLARTLVGVWPAQGGRVMLDGASLDQWSPEALGPSIGYLPQDTQLFDGSVAENIARFSPDADSAAVIDAAKAAAFHEQVLALPDGYDTRVGPAGGQLSTGQRQRLGLARALYGNPFLVVLDEPNSNLDSEGEAAVGTAIAAVKARGAIALVIAHRPSAIAAVDLIMVMKEGEAVAFGPKEKVLAKTVQNAGQILARQRQRVNGGTPQSAGGGA
ncbi:MAG TPA: type I secretion system permease/ATPase [Hyphomicrobiaceae bacterium]|nr:type I secretion system permease/ATPase [Hyphomicrobiaceae bacterium]